MKTTNIILLPGLDKQAEFLLEKINLNGLSVLVVGSQSSKIADLLSKKNVSDATIIVEDYDSLINSQLELKNSGNIKIKLMDFERMDFLSEQFDLIYAQASISNLRRKKIVKEFKRITKQNSFFCIGEIVKLKKDIPVFIQDIFNSANLQPLFIDDLENYYTERNFKVIGIRDLSNTLKEFYTKNIELLKTKSKHLSNNEKSYYKKLLKQISHESNAFLKLGADKFIGFKTLLLEKV